MMFEQHEDHKPIAWMRGHPLFATHLIVIFFSATMCIATVLGPQAVASMTASLGFFSRDIFSGQVWRILTYGLVNPPGISFVIDMFVIAWFGREMERFFGRKVFLWFFGTLYLLVPVVLTLLGFWRPTALVGEVGGFAIFIAFATLYPGAILVFNIPAKWLAAVAVAIYSLVYFYRRNVVEFTALWTTVGFAYLFVRYHQGRLHLPRFRLQRGGPKLRVVPRQEVKSTFGSADDESADALDSEVDALLEKIARHGLSSLSGNERARLEQAREHLLKKERK